MKKKIEHKQQSGKKNLSAAAKHSHPDGWKHYSALLIIVLISFFAYLPVLKNGFVNWDDDTYIQNNPLIHSINLKEIFSGYVVGNYHPLTILTYAIEYHFFALNETGYHAVNLLLHLLNVILVFYTVLLLSDKAVVALVASQLFGIHPIHVESVAWAAELKDLLYTFFFLASYIFYLKYLKDMHKKFYVLALVLFSLSLLSKAMAASLPVVLLLTDYFMGRKINRKTWLEKIPFFALSIALGVVAVMAQKSSGATDGGFFPFAQRIVFACYGFITYLFNLLLPLNLCAFYPYPVKNGADIPFAYYPYVLFFSAFVAYIFYSLRFSKKIIFGTGFFAVTVFLVLQLLPVGEAIIADRYSYLPSIGIFYLAGEGVHLLWSRKLNWIVVIMISAFTVFFSVSTYARCLVWKNGMTLWNDVISKYQTIPQAYVNRGIIFRDTNRDDEALKDFNKAVELSPGFALARFHRGTLLTKVKRNADAINDFSKAIELKPGYFKAYNNRGIVFYNEKRFNEAISDYNKVIELKPDYVDAFYNLGVLFLDQKKYNDAIRYFSKAIELKTDYAESYYNRGLAEYHSGKKDAACTDIKQAGILGYQQAATVLLQICK